MASRKSARNLDQALLDPASSFARPEDVLTCPDLRRRDRIQILCRWAYDATELAVAEEEGMGGGEASNLGAVVAALHRATGGFHARRSAPTKHGSFCVCDSAKSRNAAD